MGVRDLFRRRKRETFQSFVVPTAGLPRPRNVYRRFLYLDADEVLNSLTAVHGGEVAEATQRILSAGEGGGGLSLAAWVVDVEASGRKSHEIEREVTLRQTAHSAVTALLSALDAEGEIIPLETAGGEGLQENALVEFRADVQLLRSRPMERMAAIEEPPSSGWRFWKEEDEADREARELRKRGLGRCLVGLAKPTAKFDGPTILLALESRFLIGDPREFSRTATVVGQVDARPRRDREHVVIRAERNQSSVAVETVTEGMDELASGDLASGWLFNETLPIDRVAFVRDAVVLKPLCVYKASDLPRKSQPAAEPESEARA